MAAKRQQSYSCITPKPALSLSRPNHLLGVSGNYSRVKALDLEEGPGQEFYQEVRTFQTANAATRCDFIIAHHCGQEARVYHFYSTQERQSW